MRWCTPSIERENPKSTGEEFTDEDWFHRLYLGSIKTRLEICKDENGELRYIRAIQVAQVGDHLTETDDLRDDSLQMEAIYLSPS